MFHHSKMFVYELAFLKQYLHPSSHFRKKVAACAKHFVGDGGTIKGIDENNTVTDMHSLLSIHMPAYSDSIIKGVSTIMVSYSSWNGRKMHANRDLITGFLKGTLKFKVKKDLDPFTVMTHLKLEFTFCYNHISLIPLN